MKHTAVVTIFIMIVFIVTQVVGLYTINKYIDVGQDDEGEVMIVHGNTTLGEVAEVDDDAKSWTFVIIMIAVLVMTALLMLLIRYQLGNIWKYVFFLAVFFALAVVFGVYVNKYIAYAAAILLAYFKVFRPNVYVHNIVEIFVYAGITILVLPLLNMYSVIGLLIVISIYDAIAVWQSKHMVKLAKFQTASKAFAGVMIPYKMPAIGKKKVKGKKIKVKTAILGGGDIGFALIFAAVAMEYFILQLGIEKMMAFWYSLIVSMGAAIALGLLFVFSKKDKFYPAMPFISAGLLAGLGLVLLII